MLSLVISSEITDVSVAAITSTYSKIQLLDLSGSIFFKDFDVSMVNIGRLGILTRGKVKV